MGIVSFINYLKKKFPEARFEESSDPEFEDHNIHLDNDNHIQVSLSFDYFEVGHSNDDGTISYKSCSSMKEVLKYLEVI